MANEAKHTPGPWKLHNPAVDTLAVHTPGGNIAEWPTNYCPQDLADARLIAAAPDMLKALRIAQQFMSIASDWNIDEAEIDGEMRSTYDWLDVVSAAIAKATGSPQ